MPDSRAPEISIILPYRNAEEFLPECLESIRNQTFSNYELIAISDRSEDGSEEIVRKFAASDPRLRLMASTAGFVAALNLGLAEARAPLVARMDADDLMMPDRLLLQNEFLKQYPDVTLVSCQVQLLSANHGTTGFLEYIRWQNECNSTEEIGDNLYVESPFAHPSVMFRRSKVIELGNYEDGEFPEDYQLWLRMAHAGCRMARIPQVLLQWRDRPERLSRNDHRYSREAFDALRSKYLARDSRIINANRIIVWGAGRKTRQRVRRLAQYGIRIAAWIDIDPEKIGKVLDGSPVYAPEWLKDQSDLFVLIYVSNHGARDLITSALQTYGFVRGKNFLPAA